eukprot:scaffold1175_cov140-Skeletonema_dohrnii-CCMP3373.AAC.2
MKRRIDDLKTLRMEHVSSPRNNARLPLFCLMYIVISVLVPSHVHLQGMTYQGCSCIISKK